MANATYLLDVNVLIALLIEEHVHHALVAEWFDQPISDWALCAFTESGFLRIATVASSGQVTFTQATAALYELSSLQGYRYLPITANWNTLCSSLFPRLHGTKQVTDAYLLGLAMRHDMVLVTLDSAILHLAGDEYRDYVHVLESKRTRS